ncbi:MAG: cytidylate kinase-like family protein [Chloroflexi bacterium]|nr:cytidylate kinase-like family protein [Chloroflexota bacterium]
MAVITISREMGSEGDVIADMLCEELGYCRVDKEVFRRMASETGLDVEALDSMEREFTKRPRFVSQDMTSLYRKQRSAFEKDLVITEEAYARFLREAMEHQAREGNAVIVGRGGQMILSDWPGVLHVHLHAGKDVRVRRVMRRMGVDEATASRMIDISDEQRRQYIRVMHNNANWERMQYYHLVIDTGKVCPEVAAAIIVQAARHRNSGPEDCD